LVLSKVSASSAPSTALATSAVDALFLLQDSHNESSAERRQASGDGSRNDSNQKQRIDHNGRNTNFVEDETSLTPIQLPPLIETLIGTVDDQNTYTELYGRRRRKGTNKIIRKEGPKKSKTSATSSQRRRGDRSASDTVQIAAAAAAAAVWSDSARIWGRHRMRALNEEWDSALRWIAGWGQQHETGNHAAGNSFQQTQRGRGKNGASSYTIERDGTAEDFSLLFDTCVDECLENYVGRARDARGGDSGMGDILGISGDTVMNFISLCWEQNAFGAYSIVLSSLFVYIVRYLWKWWHCNMLSSYYLGESPQWILEETGAELDSSRAPNRRGQRRNIVEIKKKGHSTKKGKRRRKTRNVQNHDVAKKCTEADKTESVPALTCPVSDDEPKRCPVTSRKEALSADDNEYESAQECAIVGSDSSMGASSSNISSCTLSQCTEPPLDNGDDECPKQILIGEKSSSSNAQQFPSECFGYIHANRKMATDTSDGISSMASSFMTSSTPSPILAPVERNALHYSERYGHSVPEDSSDIIWQPRSTDRADTILLNSNSGVQSSMRNSPFRPKNCNQMDLHQNDPVVPTDEQREEASRQLREFQKMQIQRIVQRKATIAVSQHGDNTFAPLPHPVSAPGSSVSFSPASQSITISPTRFCNSVIGPPPKVKLVPTHNVGSQGFLRSHNPDEPVSSATDYLTDDELLLSNMLDEDDELETTNANVSTTVPPGFEGREVTRLSPLLPMGTPAAFIREPGNQTYESSGTVVSKGPWAPLYTPPVRNFNGTEEQPSLSLGNVHTSQIEVEQVPNVGNPAHNVLAASASGSPNWSSHGIGGW